MRQTIPVKVRVGLIAHPMEEKHFIDSIELLANDKSVGKVSLNPDDQRIPEADFQVYADSGMELKARVHCTLHGEFESQLKLQE